MAIRKDILENVKPTTPETYTGMGLGLSKPEDIFDFKFGETDTRADYLKQFGISPEVGSYKHTSDSFDMQIKRLEEKNRRIREQSTISYMDNVSRSKGEEVDENKSWLGRALDTIKKDINSIVFSLGESVVGTTRKLYSSPDIINRAWEKIYRGVFGNEMMDEAYESINKGKAYEAKKWYEENIGEFGSKTGYDKRMEGLQTAEDWLQEKAKTDEASGVGKFLSGVASIAPTFGFIAIPHGLGAGFLLKDIFVDSIETSEKRMKATGEQFTGSEILTKATGEALITAVLVYGLPAAKLAKPLTQGLGKGASLSQKAIASSKTSATKSIFNTIRSKIPDKVFKSALAENTDIALKNLGVYMLKNAARFGGIGVLRTLVSGVLAKMTTDKDAKYFGFEEDEDRDTLITMMSLVEVAGSYAVLGTALQSVQLAKGFAVIWKVGKLNNKPMSKVTFGDLQNVVKNSATGKYTSTQTQSEPKGATPDGTATPKSTVSKATVSPKTSTAKATVTSKEIAIVIRSAASALNKKITKADEDAIFKLFNKTIKEYPEASPEGVAIKSILNYESELDKELPVITPEPPQGTAEPIVTPPPVSAVEMPQTQPEQVRTTAPVRETQRANIDASPTGNTVTSSLKTGETVDVQFKVVNIADLFASIDADTVKTKDFPGQYQNRETDSAAARKTVSDVAQKPDFLRLTMSETIAEGTPVITPDGYVIAGNHRVAGFNKMLRDNPKNYNKYIAYLKDNASKFGIDLNSISDGTVLVRVLPDNVDAERIAGITNAPSVRQMSASEMAKNDTKAISKAFNKYVPNNSGNVNSKDNRSFVNTFMSESMTQEEASRYMQEDGSLNRDGVVRIENAMFYAAYKSSNLIKLFSEATDLEGTKRISSALLNVAPRILSFRNKVDNGVAYDIDIGGEIGRAAERYLNMKNNNQNPMMYASNVEIGETENTIREKNIMLMIAENSMSAKAMTETLETLVSATEATGNPSEQTLFDMGKPNMNDIVTATARRLSTNAQIEISESEVGKLDTAKDVKAKPEPATEERQAKEPEKQVSKTTVKSKGTVLYHGTAEGVSFEKFDVSKANMGVGQNIIDQGNQIYLTETKEAAEYFSDLATQNKILMAGKLPDAKSKPNVLNFVVSKDAKTLFVENMPRGKEGQAIVNKAKQDGYDLIQFEDMGFATVEGSERVYNEYQKLGRYPMTTIVLNEDVIESQYANIDIEKDASITSKPIKETKPKGKGKTKSADTRQTATVPSKTVSKAKVDKLPVKAKKAVKTDLSALSEETRKIAEKVEPGSYFTVTSREANTEGKIEASSISFDEFIKLNKEISPKFMQKALRGQKIIHKGNFYELSAPVVETKGDEVADYSEKIAKVSAAQPSTDRLGIVSDVFRDSYNATTQQAKTNNRAETLDDYKGPADPDVQKSFNSSKRPIVKTQIGMVKKVKDLVVKNFLRASVPEIGFDRGQTRANVIKMRKRWQITATLTMEEIKGIYEPIGKGLKNQMDWAVFLPDLVEDINLGKYDHRELPFGFSSKQQVIDANNEIKSLLTKSGGQIVASALDRRKSTYEANISLVNAAASKVDVDFSGFFNRQDYVHHAILEYVNQTMADPELKRTTTNILKARTGGQNAYITDAALADFLALQKLKEMEMKLTFLKDLNKLDITNTLKTDKYGDLIIPDGYVRASSAIVGFMFPSEMLKTQAVDLAQKIITMNNINSESAVAKNLMKEANNTERNVHYIVPSDVVLAYENSIKGHEFINDFDKLYMGTMHIWKAAALMAPRRAFLYQLRNAISDFSKTFGLMPKALGEVPQAIRMLNDFMLKNPTSKLMLQYIRSGGMNSGLSAIMLGDYRSLDSLNVYDKSGKLKPIHKIVNAVTKATNGLENFYQWREQIFRLSGYIYFMENVLNNKAQLPSDGYYYASIPSEIQSMDNIYDRAYKLSNDIVGAYDDVTPFTLFISKRLKPFFRFQETNNKTYFRSIKNAFYHDPNLTQKLGQKYAHKYARGKKVGAQTIWRIGKLVIMINIVELVMYLWNRIIRKEEDDQIPSYAREESHITMGKWEDKIHYISNVGSLREALAWIGWSDVYNDIYDIFTGKFSFKDKVIEMINAPYEEMTDSFAPLLMPFVEVPMGKKYFSKSNIRDNWQYIADIFHVGEIYKVVTGKPKMDGEFDWNILSFSKVFENETYFWDIYEMRNNYLASIGKPKPDFGVSKEAKSMALYNFRTSVRLNDNTAAEKYLKEYMTLGGTLNGIETSARSLNPLNSMKKEDRKDFLSKLSEHEMEVYNKGMAYYEQYAEDMVALAKKYRNVD